MAYKRGDPLVDTSLFFQAMSVITFYPLWPIAQLLNKIPYHTRYAGAEKLRAFCRRRGSRAILVSNHTTFLDPVLVTGAMLPFRVWQTLLDKTVQTPFLGTFTRLLGGVPLLPGTAGLDSILAEQETLFRFRHFLHFYPEGECFLLNQRIKPFKPGAFFIAATLDIPVIPLVTVFTKRRSLLGKPRPSQTLVVLDPLYPSAFVKRGESGKLDMDSVREFAEAARRVMQAEIDARGGTQDFYRGQMKRIRGINTGLVW